MSAKRLLITFASIALLPIAAVTLGRARRLYALVRDVDHPRHPLAVGRPPGRASPLALAGGPGRVRLEPLIDIDLFVLVALGLPNTRFFLSGFLQKVRAARHHRAADGDVLHSAQDRPDERRRIFQRACRVLQRTGESVYLSPEGERVTTGEIGHFNKGAFHLATDLRAPIVPLYFLIPPSIDPDSLRRAARGDARVRQAANRHASWRVEDLLHKRDRVRDLFVGWHAEARS